jgi:hypothetical protein
MPSSRTAGHPSATVMPPDKRRAVVHIVDDDASMRGALVA